MAVVLKTSTIVSGRCVARFATPGQVRARFIHPGLNQPCDWSSFAPRRSCAIAIASLGLPFLVKPGMAAFIAGHPTTLDDRPRESRTPCASPMS